MRCLCERPPDEHTLEEARTCLEKLADREVVRARVVPAQHWTPAPKLSRWSGR